MKKKIFKESLENIKPTKSFWGITSAILIFIVPEFIAFIWGSEISSFVELKLTTPLSLQEEYAYKGLRDVLGEGSWLNLLVGISILIWAFF